jgi:hypothetical protein
MSRDRKKNRKKVKIEKTLDRANAYGVQDPTPREAVKNIIGVQKTGVA